MPDAVNEDAPLRVWLTPNGAQFVFVFEEIWKDAKQVF